MTPQDEAKSLITNPLPSDAMVYSSCSSNVVLQTIVFLQETIAAEDEHLAYLQGQLSILKSRTISENIKESDKYILVEVPVGKVMRNPITDIIKFRHQFPEGYELCRIQQTRDIEDKFRKDMNNLEHTGIPLGIADAKIGKDLVTEFVGFAPQRMEIEVRRKQERLR